VNPLKLTRTTLSEMTPGAEEAGKLWSLKLKDLKDGKEAELFTTEKDYLGKWRTVRGLALVSNDFSANRIGCRVFSKRTFRKILKAAKLI
jgi:hypothetical protein